MAKIWLDSSDGRYSTRLLTDEEAAQRLDDVVYLADSVYEAYLRHCDRDVTWQALWRAISNEQFTRRREKELMPLEDAAREIDRLKYELAKAQRTASFFENEWDRQQQSEHRVKYADYTCVYPQPGCDVTALPLQWHEYASEILEQYNDTHGSQRRQYCCCGDSHTNLEADTIKRLRDSGFLVKYYTG